MVVNVHQIQFISIYRFAATTDAQTLDLTSTSNWSVGKSLPTPRKKHCAVAIDESQMLVVGGADSTDYAGSATEALVFNIMEPEQG